MKRNILLIVSALVIAISATAFISAGDKKCGDCECTECVCGTEDDCCGGKCECKDGACAKEAKCCDGSGDSENCCENDKTATCCDK